MENYINLARHVMHERWPHAVGGFAGGSILRGQGQPGSDIDLIVLMPGIAQAEKWWLCEQGVPFDVFVHDEETLRHFVATGYDERRPVLLNILREAVLLGNAPELRKWQRYGRMVLRHPPPQFQHGGLELLRWRYRLMDALGDYADVQCRHEKAAIACDLYEQLADLLCHRAGMWMGHGKWRGRLALSAGAEAAKEVLEALNMDMANLHEKQLLGIGRRFLEEFGGPFQQAVRNPAVPELRRGRLRLLEKR